MFIALTIIVPAYAADVDDADTGFYYKDDFGKGYYKVLSEENATVELASFSFNKRAEIVIPQTVQNKANVEYTVTAINSYAFEACTSATSVVMPTTISEIGEYTFKGFHKLKTITLPAALSTIKYGTFYFSGLESITIPDNITTISGEAFKYCKNLKDVKLTSNVTEIGYGAFAGCTNLRQITLSESLTKIADNLFAGCYNLERIQVPSKVTTIGENAFYNCTAMKEVILNEGLESIGFYAFYNCNMLSSITIPSTVSEMGAGAFYHTTGIRAVYVMSPNPPRYIDLISPGGETVGTPLFSSAIEEVATLYVPNNSQNAYQNNQNWKGFKNISEIDFKDITGIESVISEKVSKNILYNLNGQRVSDPVKGSIYIKNGKKIIF